ncbi:MAG: hypothetical protein KKF56_03080 [Nanoarchaeota archaeon]|nr:hypothetical protein [Nanoarchaeota archaeon]
MGTGRLTGKRRTPHKQDKKRARSLVGKTLTAIEQTQAGVKQTADYAGTQYCRTLDTCADSSNNRTSICYDDNQAASCSKRLTL